MDVFNITTDTRNGLILVVLQAYLEKEHLSEEDVKACHTTHVQGREGEYELYYKNTLLGVITDSIEFEDNEYNVKISFTPA